MEPTIDLAELAKSVMLERGLEPEFSEIALQQVAQIAQPASAPPTVRDLRAFLWCSIDNDDSRDLDQLTYAERSNDGEITIWIAIADVDALVEKDSPVDLHARKNTTSVYTPARKFSMLPEKLSTDLTSLNEHEDRVAIAVSIRLNKNGDIESAALFPAVVHNYAQLTYNAVGSWLEGVAPAPQKVQTVPGLEETLQVQHEAAQALRLKRHEKGALTLQPLKSEVTIEGAHVHIQPTLHNYAHQLIEEFMVAANRTMANHFKEKKIASLRRVVRTPKYWNRIVEIAEELGEYLPPEPDSKALDIFLIKRQKANPDTFPELSLTVIKLLGRGEYVVENNDDDPVGHFALALSDYTHSTAPNRRYPDLISQRQYKASVNNTDQPYLVKELHGLAAHCTQQEDAATKVERQLNKCASALFFASRIGESFQGIITGANEKGTWLRIFNPPVEGKVVGGFERLKVGDKVTAKLVSVDVLKGFIDFIAQ